MAAGALVIVTIVIWGPSALSLGLYYDDWMLLASMDDAASWSPIDLYSACHDIEPAGRPGGCVYHVGAYLVTAGGHAAAYHLLSVGFIWLSALLLYLLLVRCRLPWGVALGVAALWVVFPGSDATRLWPASVGAQLILGLYLTAVLLGIEGLRRSGGRAALLHLASFGIYFALVFTYEIVVPLIAISGAFYWLAAPGRKAIRRGVADLAFALAFVVYRTVISPVDSDTGFVVERTASETVTRVFDIAEGAWQTWQNLFLPGRAGTTGAVCALAIVIVALVARPATRAPIARWLAIALAAAGLVAMALCAYLPANDLYIPSVGSTFNRLNLAAAPAYCLGFVALLGAVFVALQSTVGRTAAIAAVAFAVGGVIAWQLQVGGNSRAAWQESWNAQTRAIAGLRPAISQMPKDAIVVSFGHPIWERDFVPVFAAGWDLRGMIDYETDHDPPAAIPFVPGASCQPQRVTLDGAPFAPYRNGPPLWFANATTGEARQIRSLQDCTRTLTDWGPPPYWGRTVAGGA